jgi:hypothetical protein
MQVHAGFSTFTGRLSMENIQEADNFSPQHGKRKGRNAFFAFPIAGPRQVKYTRFFTVQLVLPTLQLPRKPCRLTGTPSSGS